ncbi:hypothetical protein [Limnohabitans sp.]|uniref:hypothetical protein n=1 Tax=Limnohabitans sp. TaxID=1907725 RepID=UPI00286F2F45|nr:hypothetical protein [Limnohabitans sp.]
MTMAFDLKPAPKTGAVARDLLDQQVHPAAHHDQGQPHVHKRPEHQHEDRAWLIQAMAHHGLGLSAKAKWDTLTHPVRDAHHATAAAPLQQDWGYGACMKTLDVGRDLHAPNLILWQGIEALRERGVRKLDLGGVNTTRSAGIARFKMSTGGQVLTCAGTFI